MRRAVDSAAIAALLIVLTLLVVLALSALALPGAHARFGAGTGRAQAPMATGPVPSPLAPVLAQPPTKLPVTIYLVHSPEQAALVMQQLEAAALMAHLTAPLPNLVLVVSSPEEEAHVLTAAVWPAFVVVNLR